jgi:hypothetical protein
VRAGKGKEKESPEYPLLPDGPNKATGSELPALSPRVLEPTSNPYPLDAPQVLSDPPPAPALMAASTPFKTPQQFMTGLVRGELPSVASQGAPVEPDVLTRLGVGPMGSVGDHYKAAFGGTKSTNSAGEGWGNKVPLPFRPSNPFDPNNFSSRRPDASSTNRAASDQPAPANAPLRASSSATVNPNMYVVPGARSVRMSPKSPPIPNKSTPSSWRLSVGKDPRGDPPHKG